MVGDTQQFKYIHCYNKCNAKRDGKAEKFSSLFYLKTGLSILKMRYCYNIYRNKEGDFYE